MKNRYPIAVGGAFFVSILAYAYTLSPNMNLRTPATGDTDYPTSISDSFTTIDTNDHTAGKGLQVPSSGLAANSVTTVKILDANVTEAKIATDAVTEDKIADLSITTAKLAAGSVTNAKLDTLNLNLPGTTVQAGDKNVIVSNTNAATSLAIIRATFNDQGVLTDGEGIGATLPGPPRFSTGTYTITWATPFASTPIVMVTAVSAGFVMATIQNPTTTAVTIRTTNSSSGIYMDVPFSIIAIGPRN